MAQVERDVVVVQALHDVAVEAGGERHQLDAGEHLRALQRHAARHDEADVAGAEDHHALAGHVALQVDELLRGTGGVDAGAAGARGAQRAARTLAAAHREDDRLGGDDLHAVRARNAGHGVRLAVHGEDGRVGLDLDAHLAGAVDVALRVLGAGQLLLEAVQAEAVVDALAQNAARVVLALENEQVVDAILLRRNGSREARRASADDENVHTLVIHLSSPPSSRREWCRPADGSRRRTW